MGVGIKVGGIVVTGIFGFYLINKALNYTRDSVHDMTEASKWKAYYKNGHMGRMVPPGYVNHYHTDPETGETVETIDYAVEQAEKKAEIKETEKKPIDFKPIADAIEKVGKAFLKTKGIDIDKKDNEYGGYKPISYADYASKIHAVKDDEEKAEDEVESLKKEIDDILGVDDVVEAVPEDGIDDDGDDVLDIPDGGDED